MKQTAADLTALLKSVHSCNFVFYLLLSWEDNKHLELKYICHYLVTYKPIMMLVIVVYGPTQTACSYFSSIVLTGSTPRLAGPCDLEFLWQLCFYMGLLEWRRKYLNVIHFKRKTLKTTSDLLTTLRTLESVKAILHWSLQEWHDFQGQPLCFIVQERAKKKKKVNWIIRTISEIQSRQHMLSCHHWQNSGVDKETEVNLHLFNCPSKSEITQKNAI